MPVFTKAMALLPLVDVWDDRTNEGAYWHRLTQLVMGEPVLITEQVFDWARIIAIEQASSKNPLGYPGWVRAASLAPDWGGEGPTAVIRTKTSILRSAPSPNAMAIVSLYLDTRLPVLSQTADWVQLVFPNGGTGWLPAAEVRLSDHRRLPTLDNDFFALAQSYVGAPYLWGGTHPLHTDCSGFTYRLFHAYGIPLPRDSQDQARYGKPVASGFNQALDSAILQRGDLLFFTKTIGGEVSHVAIAWGNGFVLDASTPSGVQMRSLAELKAEYLLHSVRRVVEFTGK